MKEEEIINNMTTEAQTHLYYFVLGLNADEVATLDSTVAKKQITQAFKDKLTLWHSDKLYTWPSLSEEEKQFIMFTNRLINTARDVLMDDTKRRDQFSKLKYSTLSSNEQTTIIDQFKIKYKTLENKYYEKHPIDPDKYRQAKIEIAGLRGTLDRLTKTVKEQQKTIEEQQKTIEEQKSVHAESRANILRGYKNLEQKRNALQKKTMLC